MSSFHATPRKRVVIHPSISLEEAAKSKQFDVCGTHVYQSLYSGCLQNQGNISEFGFSEKYQGRIREIY